MTVVLAGSVLDSSPSQRYLETLRFAELALDPPLPRAGTLRRWRTGWPDTFSVALRAPSQTLKEAQGDGTSATPALQWTLEAAEALAAAAVIFASPLDVTPGQRSRDQLRAFFARLPAHTDRLWVWEPSGLWEPEQAFRFAAQLDVICAYDPLASGGAHPEQPVRYARLLGVGARARYSIDALERVYAAVSAGDCERAFVAIASQRAAAEARLLQQIADAG